MHTYKFKHTYYIYIHVYTLAHIYTCMEPLTSFDFLQDRAISYKPIISYMWLVC